MTYEDLHDVRKHSFNYKAEGHWPSQDRQTERNRGQPENGTLLSSSSLMLYGTWHTVVQRNTKVRRYMALVLSNSEVNHYLAHCSPEQTRDKTAQSTLTR